MQREVIFNDKLIISLYDFTGEWAKPYIEAGYPVMLWDYKVEGCILENIGELMEEIYIRLEQGYRLYGILAAPPCTEFAGSGAQWWPAKDKTEITVTFLHEPVTVTEFATMLVEIVLILVEKFKPEGFWVLENPVGRIERCVPALKPYRRHTFHPCQYGDAYTKKTILWGDFNEKLPENPVDPEYIIWAGKKFLALFKGTGGKSEKTKTIRSTTPAGFAKAFFNANQ